MRIQVSQFVSSVRALIVTLALVLFPVLVQAADNQGTGDVAGDIAALAPSNVFQLNATQLALVKRAFLANGTALTSGATLPRGTLVKFLVYVNNTTGIAVTDLSVRDSLVAGFGYQVGTARVDTAVANCASGTCTPVEESAIYAAVNAQAAGTDGVDADPVSYTPGVTSVDVGDQRIANAAMTVPANRVWALLFTARIQ
ncbi:MAG: hypothetical protein HOP12_07560 [Candidatus Eisenbacteria bacterium]|uniref:DUF11 domain-containing protein n=1 Tax=Eiseniibacteriota bacterium TaxID=2212470 RepID=A0A849SRJ1_UNCEI|nr:hypothetical protein [Candidatus Eisenbacteria bacterium]